MMTTGTLAPNSINAYLSRCLHASDMSVMAFQAEYVAEYVHPLLSLCYRLRCISLDVRYLWPAARLLNELRDVIIGGPGHVKVTVSIGIRLTALPL